MEFSKPEYWNGQLFSSPGDLSNPGIKPRSPALQGILYQLSHKGSPREAIREAQKYGVACSFSSGSSLPRNWTRVSCIAGGFFTNWAMREAQDQLEKGKCSSLTRHIGCHTAISLLTLSLFFPPVCFARSLSVLLILLKNQLFVSLILSIVYPLKFHWFLILSLLFSYACFGLIYIFLV